MNRSRRDAAGSATARLAESNGKATAAMSAAPPAAAGDAFDQVRTDNVRPPGWVNPEPKARYHLVVLGAGSGGLVSAAIAVGLGARVALVERDAMGGDCLNHGCVPSKALLRAARAWREAATAADRFGGPNAVGQGDFAAAMRRMRRLRAQISHVDSAARFRDLGVDVFFGAGRFSGPDTLRVGAAELRFRNAIIATGSRPLVPPVPGLEESEYLTNETVFDLDRLPARLAAVGAGPIGCELAQAFARFGSRVQLLDVEADVLPREERCARQVVRRSLERDGVEFLGRTRLVEVRREGCERVLRCERDGGSAELRADALLVAVGRVANVEALGLEAAGVDHDRHGVKVDGRLRTSNRRIFAVGDVCTPHKFTHVADAHARIAVQNALFFGRARADRLHVPWATYTEPEVARVGLSPADAAADGIAVDTVHVPLEDVDRAVLEDAEHGFVRIHLRQGTDRVVGATIVADRAGDLISQVTQLMAGDGRLGRFGRVVFPYPTTAEALRKAADRRRREKLTPTVRKLFRLFFRAIA